MLEDDTVDAIPSIAQAVPMKVVGDLVGVPDDGRHLLLDGAGAVFSQFAPRTEYVIGRLPDAFAYMQWITDVAERGEFTRGSWGDTLSSAHADGRLSFEEIVSTMNGFLVAGLDTTVNSLGTLLRVFADRPDVWDAVRADPAKIPAVFEETLRYRPPVTGFFRRAARDLELLGTPVARGDAIFVVHASANHDERHYADPERFDPARNPVDHLAMGSGIHSCVGGALARVEATAVVRSLIERVSAIEPAGPAVSRYHPLLRGLSSLPLRFTLRKELV